MNEGTRATEHAGLDEAARLMEAFAERTGLTSRALADRYLWTDAFAVSSYLALERVTGERRYLDLALKLVAQVHRVLGRHRGDDARSGWLDGRSDEEAAEHPTIAGLRIGKPLPERGEDESGEDEQDWDRDGQYFHYLTRWMLALDRLALRTGDGRFNRWARELAATAVTRFDLGGRLAWKLSVDLSRPVVGSSGQHDALDGFVVIARLRATARTLGTEGEGPGLSGELAVLEPMLAPGGWATPDPLGIGGLLSAAGVLEELHLGERLRRLHRDVVRAALLSLRVLTPRDLDAPAQLRLGFRELGLAIGLRACGDEAIAPHRPLGEQLVAFWAEPGNRANRIWLEHRNINEVMLASALAGG